MKVAEIMKDMICYSQGNTHDINHLMKVFTYAQTIAECESVDETTKTTVEIAAIVHDIACPLCREKYGNTNGRYQEAEGVVLAKEFLENKGLSLEMVERVAYLVGHHHTLTNVDGMDYQILLEADYLVNADESNYNEENIRIFKEKVFRTKTGLELLKDIYGI